MAVVLYNKGEFPINITVDLSDIMAFNLTATNSSGAPPLFRAHVENLFDDERSDVTFNITAMNVPPHGSSMYRVSALPSGWIPNTGKSVQGGVLLQQKKDAFRMVLNTLMVGCMNAKIIGNNQSSLVAASCGANPGNPAWKAVDGVLLFECGKYGWDACQIPNATVQPWINFDFGEPTVIDGFALWNGGDGQHDVREEGQEERNIERAGGLGDHLCLQLFRRNTGFCS